MKRILLALILCLCLGCKESQGPISEHVQPPSPRATQDELYNAIIKALREDDWHVSGKWTRFTIRRGNVRMEKWANQHLEISVDQMDVSDVFSRAQLKDLTYYYEKRKAQFGLFKLNLEKKDE